MGYAISISDVEDKLNTLMNETTREKVDDANRGALGIKAATVSESTIQLYGMPEGVFVHEVTEGSAADNADVKKSDIITAFDGKKVTTIQQLVELLQYYSAGESVEVTLQRMNNGEYEEISVTVTLDKAESTSQEAA